MTSKIIIAGLVAVAFVAGSIMTEAAVFADKDNDNPKKVKDAGIIAALTAIADAITGIEPDVTVEPTVNVDVPPAEVQIIGIEGPQGPPGILGPEFVDEVDARIAGDNALGTLLDAEKQARISEDNTLQFKIDAEEQARIAGDNTLDVSKQDRVFDFCAPGQSIRVINEDGTVVCEEDSDTKYTAGHGLVLNSGAFAVDTFSLQSRVSDTCPVGQSIRVISTDGTVVCETDNGVLGSASSSGLSQFFDSVSTTRSCPTGHVMVGLTIDANAGSISDNIDEIRFNVLCRALN